MYSQDTFFHLTTNGRLGLILLSFLLSAFLIGLFWKISNRFKLPIKLILAIIFIWIFIWMSPQIYYLYYIQIIDGLPLQNVIQTPPSPIEILQTVTFTGQSNLSNHSKGVLFWIMVTIALYAKTKK